MKKVELFVNNSESIAQCNSPNYSIGSPNDHFEKKKKGRNPMILISKVGISPLPLKASWDLWVTWFKEKFYGQQISHLNLLGEM